MLCDRCHEREATVHTTQVVGGVPKHSHLCEQCAKVSRLAEARASGKALKAGCRYCGGEPCFGGADPLARLSGIQKTSFMCYPCAEEYFRFLGQRLPGFGEVTITAEQMVKIRTADMSAIFREAEEHMEKWVAEKNSR